MGGLFRHVCDHVRGQVRLGLTVAIICDSLTGGDYAEHTLGQLSSDYGVKVHRIPMCRTLGWADKATLNRTNEICRQVAPDILHGHGAKGGAYARLLARLHNLKSVYTPHGGALHYDPKHPIGIFYLAFERLLRFISNGIIFESKFSQETYLKNIGPIHGPHRVIHNGLFIEEFKSAFDCEDCHDFLFIGELRMLKGLDVLLQATALLKTKRPISVQIVGDGPDLNFLKSRIRELELDTAVTIRPRMFPANSTFSLAKCIVIPSLKESLPYIVLEAAAAKIPQLTTNVGGIPEIFGPYTDRLIPSDNPEALAVAMGNALDNPKLAQDFALLLHKHVKKFFRVENMVAETIDFYEQVLKSQ